METVRRGYGRLPRTAGVLMPWPWWVYCIVPGTAVAVTVVGWLLQRSRPKDENPYASGRLERVDEL